MSQPYDTPLFGEPDKPKAARVQSHKDRDDALNKVTWTRYKVPGVVCWEWANAAGVLSSRNCGPAAWLRVQGEDQRALCYHHKAEYLARGQ